MPNGSAGSAAASTPGPSSAGLMGMEAFAGRARRELLSAGAIQYVGGRDSLARPQREHPFNFNRVHAAESLLTQSVLSMDALTMHALQRCSRKHCAELSRQVLCRWMMALAATFRFALWPN